MKKYEFEAEIKKPQQKGGAYVEFPYDIKEEFGKGRVKVDVTFDGIDYTGSIVNMGIKRDDGSICYIIGMLKEIREKLNKDIGDKVIVTVKEVNEMDDKKFVDIPVELTEVLENEEEAREFFDSLTDGYKRGYCKWVGGAKGEATRKTRAQKALIMLQNKQKILKT